MPDQTTRIIPSSGSIRRSLEVTVERFAVRVEDGPDRGRTAELSSTSLVVGSDPACDLVLTDSTVSRRHAMLTMTAQGVLAEDLDSTNGSWLSGARIRSAYVPDGATLVLGSTSVRIVRKPDSLVVYPDTATSFFGLLGGSQAMRDLFALVRQMARTDLPLLVTGETGTGKELVARAIHQASPRNERPFLILDCGSIVPGLLRSEIFGHEKGAFTGAERASPGVLEAAAGGTVFFDEVGEIEIGVQSNLLRALETREVVRLGSKQPLPVDFRVVAATNRDLAAMVRDGKFREDLYYRLACVTIRIPPLRERLDDVRVLAQAFVERFAERNRMPAPALTPEAVRSLEAYQWPGNVRQLKNVVEAVAAMAAGSPIGRQHVLKALPAVPVPEPAAGASKSPLEDAEKSVIEKALASTGGKRRAAAKLLGISPTTLLAKIRRYGLSPGADDE